MSFLSHVLFHAQAFLFLLACVPPTLACIPSATHFPSLAQLPSPWSGAFPLSFPHAILLWCTPFLSLSCGLSFAHAFSFSSEHPFFSHTLPHSFHLFMMSFLFFAWLSFLCIFPFACFWCMCPFTLQCMQAAFLILPSFPCLDCQCFSLSCSPQHSNLTQAHGLSLSNTFPSALLLCHALSFPVLPMPLSPLRQPSPLSQFPGVFLSFFPPLSLAGSFTLCHVFLDKCFFCLFVHSVSPFPVFLLSVYTSPTSHSHFSLPFSCFVCLALSLVCVLTFYPYLTLSLSQALSASHSYPLLYTFFLACFPLHTCCPHLSPSCFLPF